MAAGRGPVDPDEPSGGGTDEPGVPIGDRLPDLRLLHERHEGLPNPECECWARAAEVCLARHGSPPTNFDVTSHGERAYRELAWKPPDLRAVKAWGNPDNATEYGAYPLAIASLEATYGLFAMERTDTKTGADWYVGPPGSEEGGIEEWHRLEVSGVDAGERSAIAARVRRKVKQAGEGRSDRPAIVGVVGFKEAIVLIRAVEDAVERK